MARPAIHLLWWLTGLVLLGGCVGQRHLPYLQNPAYAADTLVRVANTPRPYLLQPHDILSIRVQSPQPEFNELFNVADARAAFGSDPGTLYLSGYVVGPDGQIILPTVGPLKVSGLDVPAAQAAVQQRVGGFVRGANVVVKLLSFKLTVLGEVRNPGRYFVYGGQATVLEGLGLAGDLTEFGNRHNVKLIRQTPTGPAVVLLDLTDPTLLGSAYYYLLPNDALYVEPLRARAARANANNLGLAFAGISALVLLLSYLKIN